MRARNLPLARQSVPGAFGSVAGVPVEVDENVCTDVCTVKARRDEWGMGMVKEGLRVVSSGAQ